MLHYYAAFYPGPGGPPPTEGAWNPAPPTAHGVPIPPLPPPPHPLAVRHGVPWGTPLSGPPPPFRPGYGLGGHMFPGPPPPPRGVYEGHHRGPHHHGRGPRCDFWGRERPAFWFGAKSHSHGHRGHGGRHHGHCHDGPWSPFCGQASFPPFSASPWDVYPSGAFPPPSPPQGPWHKYCKFPRSASSSSGESFMSVGLSSGSNSDSDVESFDSFDRKVLDGKRPEEVPMAEKGKSKSKGKGKGKHCAPRDQICSSSDPSASDSKSSSSSSSSEEDIPRRPKYGKGSHQMRAHGPNHHGPRYRLHHGPVPPSPGPAQDGPSLFDGYTNRDPRAFAWGPGGPDFAPPGWWGETFVPRPRGHRHEHHRGYPNHGDGHHHYARGRAYGPGWNTFDDCPAEFAARHVEYKASKTHKAESRAAKHALKCIRKAAKYAHRAERYRSRQGQGSAAPNLDNQGRDELEKANGTETPAHDVHQQQTWASQDDSTERNAVNEMISAIQQVEVPTVRSEPIDEKNQVMISDHPVGGFVLLQPEDQAEKDSDPKTQDEKTTHPQA